MSKILSIVFIAFTLCEFYCFAELNNTVNFQWRKMENKAFCTKEKLEYSVHFGVLNIGDAILEVKNIEDYNGRQIYHLVSEMKSNSFSEKFYKIRSIEESWMDTESLCSLKYVRYQERPDRSEHKTANFDQINRKFSFIEINPQTNGVEKDVKGEIPEFVNDSLSVIYFIRTLPLEIDKEYSIYTHADDKNYLSKLVVKKKEKVKTSTGEFNCFVTESLAIDISEKKPVSTSKLFMWLTDDERKIPVLMKTKLYFGTITMKLKKISKN